MTKIGEGGQIPIRTDEPYKIELQRHIGRFEEALNGYSSASPEEQTRCFEIMKGQLALIRANVQEIKISGIHKQGEIVSSDFEKFSKSPTEANLIALQQDMGTLKEYVTLS